MNETSHRVLEKAIRLIESRAKVKVKNAVLLLETDYGPFQFELHSDVRMPSNLMLANRYVTERMVQMFTRRHAAGQLVECRKCAGVGETIDGDVLITCDRCKGGGVMAITINKEDYESSTVGSDNVGNKGEAGQSPESPK